MGDMDAKHDPNPLPQCDHICLEPEGHDGPHFYGYRFPSPMREIERLRAENEALRAENESWRSLDQIRLGLLRQSAAEVQRLQALIDAYVTADRKLFHFDLRVGIAEVYAEREQALAALLDAATKEDDRG